ncbi:hypothetical protein HHI36_014990 [Cryptolaemus montrouzieri]|uniref:Uncharacterized protein n=1 Tax=Cryptolaemus montrouzieri TaxID=559131 RepID=A0ABD2N4E1_9CUCU
MSTATNVIAKNRMMSAAEREKIISFENGEKGIMMVRGENVDLRLYMGLTQCIGGYTQNCNESFNSTVWVSTPKSTASGKTVLDVATGAACLAVEFKRAEMSSL